MKYNATWRRKYAEGTRTERFWMLNAAAFVDKNPTMFREVDVWEDALGRIHFVRPPYGESPAVTALRELRKLGEI